MKESEDSLEILKIYFGHKSQSQVTEPTELNTSVEIQRHRYWILIPVPSNRNLLILRLHSYPLAETLKMP